jgi:hypothetical protein
MSSVTPLHVTFDHRYFTRPELGRRVAAVLAHKPHSSVLVLGQFERIREFLLQNFGAGIIHISAEKDVEGGGGKPPRAPVVCPLRCYMRFLHSVRSLSQGTSEVHESAVLSTTATASCSHNDRGRRQTYGPKPKTNSGSVLLNVPVSLPKDSCAHRCWVVQSE